MSRTVYIHKDIAKVKQDLTLDEWKLIVLALTSYPQYMGIKTGKENEEETVDLTVDLTLSEIRKKTKISKLDYNHASVKIKQIIDSMKKRRIRLHNKTWSIPLIDESVKYYKTRDNEGKMIAKLRIPFSEEFKNHEDNVKKIELRNFVKLKDSDVYSFRTVNAMNLYLDLVLNTKYKKTVQIKKYTTNELVDLLGAAGKYNEPNWHFRRTQFERRVLDEACKQLVGLERIIFNKTEPVYYKEGTKGDISYIFKYSVPEDKKESIKIDENVSAEISENQPVL